MDTQVQAQIYLADQRGSLETHAFLSYHTFNFGPYQDESRAPFGSLQLLNEDTLRAGASLTMQVEQGTRVILLPVTGSLEHKSDLSTATDFLEPGQVGIFSLEAGMHYTIINPYETDLISCIQIWLTNTTDAFSPAFQQTHFDQGTKNFLLPLFESADSRGFIGQYDGRQEGVYSLGKSTVNAPTSGIYVFVLKGVFEVANRLLHEKDGLALRYAHEAVVEFEALSNDAILVLLEIS